MGKEEMGGLFSTYAGLDTAAGGNKKIRVKNKSEPQERYRDWHTTETSFVLLVSV